MIEYVMFRDCGCCEEDQIFFNSDEEAQEAVRNIGFLNGAELVDAKGVKHGGLDTFGGIRRAGVIEERNMIAILMDQLKGN